MPADVVRRCEQHGRHLRDAERNKSLYLDEVTFSFRLGFLKRNVTRYPLLIRMPWGTKVNGQLLKTRNYENSQDIQERAKKHILHIPWKTARGFCTQKILIKELLELFSFLLLTVQSCSIALSSKQLQFHQGKLKRIQSFSCYFFFRAKTQQTQIEC